MTMQEIISRLFKTENEQYLYYREHNMIEFKYLHQACYSPNIRYNIDEVFTKIIRDPRQLLLDDLIEKWGNKKIYRMLRNRQTLYVMLFVIVYAMKDNKTKAREFSLLLTFKFYASLLYKYFKYCNKQRFEIAESSLSHSHLFKVKKGIPEALVYLNDVILNKFYSKLKFNDSVTIIKWVYELRHRINQSLRAFSRVYYNVNEGLTSSQISSDEKLDNGELVINNLIQRYLNKFQLLKDLNLKLLNDINQHYNVNITKMINVMKELQDTKYHDELMHILSILINNQNAHKLKDELEWNKEVIKFLGQKVKNNFNVRILIAKLLIQLQSFKTGFLEKGDITRRRVVNIVITYLMLSFRDFIF